MGRIAELYEKKALGTITDAEQKELETLLKEAAATAAETKATDAPEDANLDGAIDELAQKLADAATERMEAGLAKVLDGLKPETPTPSSAKDAEGFIVDKALGSADKGYKLTVKELSEIKEDVPGRENKKIKQVSARTKHFLAALLTNNEEKLQVLSEGVPGDGGYLVPEEFANMIVEDIRDEAVMRRIAAPAITIKGDTLHLPALTSRPQANWRAEKAVKQTSTASFGELVFTPFSLATIVGLSNELVADAQLGVGASIVNYISQIMATALNEKEEKAFFTGSGTGQPKGIFGNTGRTFTANPTDASRADTIIQAYSMTPQGYRNKAAWVANMGTLANINELKDNNGRYLLKELAEGNTSVLKGRPVYEQNDLAGGTAIFGDFSFYQIVDREGISVKVSDEATVAGQSAFERNLTFIRVEKRVDAKPTLAAAFTTVNGLGTP